MYKLRLQSESIFWSKIKQKYAFDQEIKNFFAGQLFFFEFKNTEPQYRRPSLLADFLSANSLIHIGKMVRYDNFQVKNGFLSANSRWLNVSTANYSGYLGSISPTFYVQLLCQQSCTSKVQTLNVSTKKLRTQLMYVKAAHRRLVKLTPVYIRNTLNLI